MVVPYQYTLILWSVLFGWQIFGEVPDAYTMIGAAIIVAAGLYIFWREQVAVRIRRRASEAHDGATVRVRHARRHRLDADRRVPVLAQRRGRQVAGRDLFGRAAAADPQRHDADPARPFIWRAGRAAFMSAPRPGLQVLRVVLSTLEVAMFFWAVAYLPLADAITFYLAGPIYVTALSALLLGERVGWRRWTAVLVGFCGVVIALRPSAASFTLPALIALGGSVVLRAADDHHPDGEARPTTRC